jgi:hypothetical protein
MTHTTLTTLSRVMTQQSVARVGLCAAAIALSAAGYTAIAYAGPEPCDPSTDLNCQGTPPPAQGSPAPRPPRQIPTDQLTTNPQAPPPRDPGRLAPGENPSWTQGPQNCGSNCPVTSTTLPPPQTTNPWPNGPVH